LPTDAYLRESILNPSQHYNSGLRAHHAHLPGASQRRGVIALVEYIRHLDSDYRVQQTTNTTDLLPESEGKAAPAAQAPLEMGR